MSSIIQISPETLFPRIGRPDCPVLIDGRIDEDFDADPRIVPGSVRLSCFEAPSWAGRYIGRELVVICDGGLKLSEGAAAWARHLGVDAVNLAGGYRGWRDAGYPVIPGSTSWKRDEKGRTVWVTGRGAPIAVLARCWFIRRFVDRDAVFLFVTPSQVAGVVDKMGAVPLPTANEPPFHDLFADLGPLKPRLAALFEILSGLEAAQSDQAASGMGLVVLARGLMAAHPDDLSRLNGFMSVFDALFGGLDQ